MWLLCIVGCFILSLLVLAVKGLIANKQTVRPYNE